MAKKLKNARGRTWAALFLLGFVLVAASVIQRRELGRRQAQANMKLGNQRQDLVSAKKRLEGEIEEAKSLGRIGPIVEKKLGMHAPNESPTVISRKIPRQ